MVKKCSKCKEIKDISLFTKDKSSKDGTHAYCKSCNANIKREYYKNNKNKCLENNKKYIKKKGDKTDLEKNIYKARRSVYKVVKMFSEIDYYIGTIGIDPFTFKKHIESNFKKGMSWSNYGEWHIDHVIPIGKSKNKKEVEQRTHYTNLLPSWPKDNLTKGAKIIDGTQTLLTI